MTRRVIQAVRDGRRQWAPHDFGSAVSIIAALHLLAAFGDGLMLEFDVNPNPLRENLLTDPIIRRGDLVQVPEGFDLGIELRDKVVTQLCL